MALPQLKATEIHFPLLKSGGKKINTRVEDTGNCSLLQQPQETLTAGWGADSFKICGWEQTQARGCLPPAHLLKENTRQEISKNIPGGIVDKNPPANARWSSLVWEESTCHRAAKSTFCNYLSLCTQSLCSATREATAVTSLCRVASACCNQRKPTHSSKDPAQSK